MRFTENSAKHTLPRTNTARALWLSLSFFLLLAPVAAGKMCSSDNVPAATLLVPYFEVDLANPDGITTLLSIHNTWAEPTLIQVTLWTDWAQPTISFPLFFTGFDTLTFDMRNLFTEGFVPVSADLQTDPLDIISPHGNNPPWDGSFEGCENFFPFTNPALSGSLLDLLVNGHTGQPVALSGGLCAGSDHGDLIARGYVTLDDVGRCALLFPNDAGYFGDSDPVATTDNQLTGDFILFNAADETSVGSSMVHVEADPDFDLGSAGTGYTFYGTYTAPDGDDYREPLGKKWGVPFRSSSTAEQATDWVVWRDSTSADNDRFYTCGGGPSWLPLSTTPFVCWNEEEDVFQGCLGEDCFPLQSQRVGVGEPSLEFPFESGWCQIDLEVNDEGVVGDVDFPEPGDALAQSWIGALEGFPLRLSGFSSVLLQNVGKLSPELFVDGFESGDTTFWSSTFP